MTLRPRSAVLLLLVTLVSPSNGLGQPAPATQPSSEANGADHVGHSRNLDPRTPRLPVQTSDGRLTTSRIGSRALSVPVEQSSFTFVIFGDRTGGPAEGVNVLADAVRDVNLLAPDLVMTVGDLVQGYNTEDKWLEQMREYRAIMDMLLCPWFPVAGNHDIYWRGAAGQQRPEREHEKNYETHFGPLWYAFKHKNCLFVVLFSDEGNPQTGEKTFHKPESQKISPEQLDWLRRTLEANRSADHVFVFLHHPRWLGTVTDGPHRHGYGDDWNRVHELLKANGNVRAVFAGHIHEMRHEKRDGIDYFTLATTGGGQTNLVPSAGFTHQYHVVNVRKDSVAVAAYPVGAAMDPREITGTLVADVRSLATATWPMEGSVKLSADGSANGELSFTIQNPTQREVEVAIAADSRDSRWTIQPETAKLVLKPGQQERLTFRVSRPMQSFDEYFRPAVLAIDATYNAPTFRYALPQRRIDLPLDLDAVRPPVPPQEMALRLDGVDDAIFIPSSDVGIVDGPFTIECWFNADRFPERSGLICKTQSSDYGLFVNGGRPSFSVYLGDGYASVRGKPDALKPGTWHHIAGVFDGKEARLYVDGRMVATGTRPGVRKRNDLPLVIGGDVSGEGTLDSPFAGLIDAVRISKGARYVGESFEPQRRLAADDNTTLLLNFDGKVGPWVLDESPRKRKLTPRGGAVIVPAE